MTNFNPTPPFCTDCHTQTRLLVQGMSNFFRCPKCGTFRENDGTLDQDLERDNGVNDT